MEDVIRFAGRDWLVTEATKSTLIIRSVNTIARLCWHDQDGEVVNWSDCSLRKYLNREFYQSIPNEDRARIIPVINTTNTRKIDNFETTEDRVWLETIENIESFIHERDRIATWLRNPLVANTRNAWYVWSDGFPGSPLDFVCARRAPEYAYQTRMRKRTPITGVLFLFVCFDQYLQPLVRVCSLCFV